jgi:hypothetical protein
MASLSFFAAMRHDLDEADRFIAAAWVEEDRLGQADDPWVPSLAWWVEVLKGRWMSAIAHAHETERRGRAIGDRVFEELGVAQQGVCLALRMVSDDLPASQRASALMLMREALDRAEHHGQPSGIAAASATLGRVLAASEPTEAVRLLERALDMAGPLDSELIAAPARADLVSLYGALGRSDAALAMLGVAIQRHTRSGAWLHVWTSLEPLPRPLAEAGCPEVAAVVMAVCRQQPDAEFVAARNGYAELEAELRDHIGSDQVDQLLKEGRRMTLADAAQQVVQTIDALLA